MFANHAVVAALAAALLCLFAAPGRSAAVRFDFETGDLQGWAVMDGKFDQLVTDRAFYHNEPTVPCGKQGRFFLSTLERADGTPDDTMTGVVESPVFRLTGPRITVQVGGGGHDDTYVALCTEDGAEVLRASGANSEHPVRIAWDARRWVGKLVYVSVVDRNTGSWGHVTLDDFEAQGVIDPAATARVRGTFAEREARRAQLRADAVARARKEAQARLAALLRDPGLSPSRRPRIYRGANLDAIRFTVGGIGAGSLQMDGRAMRPAWQIFNNYRYLALPNTFFAVRARAAGAAPAVVRALQTEAAGAFPAMKRLAFTGEFPLARYAFDDPALPVAVSMEAFTPFVPTQARDSAIPCAIFQLTAANRSQRAVDVSFLGTQQNAVGCTGAHDIIGRKSPEYGENRNRIVVERGATILHMTGTQNAGRGDMALVAVGPRVSATASWGTAESLASQYAATGRIAGPSEAGPTPDGETVDGALAVPFRLAPGESKTVTFVLAWYFPDVTRGGGAQGWTGSGNRYMTWWPSALDVARDVRARLPKLVAATRLYHDSLYETNLPRWLVDRVSSQVAILCSKTCFWTKEGFFGGWEGCGSADGCCPGNCNHVWHYAQAHARLFPEIGRMMRRQELESEDPQGGIPHRQIGEHPAFDGQCGGILGAYREHLCSADDQWLRKYWKRIRAAMDYTIRTWDSDEDGVLAGPQWNTLDCAVSGSTSWLGSLYLAALEASERMAETMGDTASAERYAAICKKGMATQDRTLFNGEYYAQIIGDKPQRDYGPGCQIDQVLGQWWARQVNLRPVYPDDRVRTALRSLFRHNFHASFAGLAQSPRKFVADEDGGLQMITWPHGGRPDGEHTTIYADEVMTGFEYAAAVAMMDVGLSREALAVLRTISDRYDGRLRTGLSGGDFASWGYSGNPFGDDECGKFYARAMSSWSALISAQGFVYDGPAGRIGFLPRWRPENHRSFFTAAEGWGVFAQRRTARKMSAAIAVRYGKLRVREIVLAAPPAGDAPKVTVRAAGAIVPASVSVAGGELRVRLRRDVTLRAGQSAAVTATW